MKKFAILFSAVALFALSFTNPVEVVNMTVDTDASNIEWVGKKVTGQHNGLVKVKEGSLEYTDGQLSGGSFVIDMTSISVEDLTGNMKGKLEGHLKSPDFFGTEIFPTAKFVITDVISYTGGKYRITGDLTIKETTKSIKFNTELEEGDDSVAGVANITIDRSEFDVRYGSGSFFDNLGDKTIYDEFDLKVNLVAKK